MTQPEQKDEAPLATWMRERRLGTFYLADMFIETEPEMARIIMASVFPVRIEHRYDMVALEVGAFGPDFEPVAVGIQPPEYQGICMHDGKYTASFMWEKVK